MVVLDTDILVSLLKGDAAAIEKIRILREQQSSLATTIVTAYELLKGAHLSSKVDENLGKVRGSLSSLLVLDFSFGAAEEATKIYKELRERGKMIGEFDVLIAGIARFYGEALVTRDADYTSIRGIKIIKW